MAVPSRISILGGGRMGIGIAHAFLLAGAHVHVLERDDEAATSASGRLARVVQTSIERASTTTDAATLLDRAHLTSHPADVASAELVVEAVPEDVDLKRDVLREAERHMRNGTWLATNTSSLPIDSLAEHLDRPERLIGLHFFNPVPASQLVEIVHGRRTSAPLLQLAQTWVDGIGKTGIIVRDSPGFASSRLGVVIALEAIRMVEENVASAADIDTAMVLGYKFPIGPLHLTDIVGLDVRLGIAEHLEAELGPRFAAPALLRTKVAEGTLGRKTGEGFYPWP